jgi:hypothetical protein
MSLSKNLVILMATVCLLFSGTSWAPPATPTVQLSIKKSDGTYGDPQEVEIRFDEGGKATVKLPVPKTLGIFSRSPRDKTLESDDIRRLAEIMNDPERSARVVHRSGGRESIGIPSNRHRIFVTPEGNGFRVDYAETNFGVTTQRNGLIDTYSTRWTRLDQDLPLAEIPMNPERQFVAMLLGEPGTRRERLVDMKVLGMAADGELYLTTANEYRRLKSGASNTFRWVKLPPFALYLNPLDDQGQPRESTMSLSPEVTVDVLRSLSRSHAGREGRTDYFSVENNLEESRRAGWKLTAAERTRIQGGEPLEQVFQGRLVQEGRSVDTTSQALRQYTFKGSVPHGCDSAAQDL